VSPQLDRREVISLLGFASAALAFGCGSDVRDSVSSELASVSGNPVSALTATFTVVIA
jgi:hypothetical protein